MGAADEVLDVVDRDDRVTGRAPRGEVYARGLLHRCVFVLARDDRGRVFVHRRTASKLVFPSRYDMFVGGVLGAGEDYASAALREAEEELGVSGLARPEPLFKFLYEGPGGGWWSYVHEVRCGGLEVRPQESEVAWHAWLPENELEGRIADGSWPWVPDGLEAYRRLRAFREGGERG
ncbi:NUDIX domain-containing protein [Streptomyces sp. 2P-4]|uniref:NUDIX hydrolase n=1 Tax=Streptomyces sp. 2P-4 TaxID=2931974 RepID=UPI0025419D50|nr:NUDIX domain-containing protein [Streptomyces sp. 2P-4]